MIGQGWYDQEFIRSWSNGPLLVRSDTNRLLKAEDVTSNGGHGLFLAWNARSKAVVRYDPAVGRYDAPAKHLALQGEYPVSTIDGIVNCRPVFDRYLELCERYSAETIAEICWISPEQLRAAARTIWDSRPVSYYAWSGHEHHPNTTEAARAIAMLYALTGSFDASGGNVLLPSVPAPSITGEDLTAAKRLAPAIGRAERPLGPARWNNVSTLDFYRAVLESDPYPVRTLVGFGANLLLAQADPVRGRAALSSLDFYAHTDLFMNPTAAVADVVLPVASCFEREALKIGFEISENAQSHVQLRSRIVPPPGEARSDTDIIFDLAARLGLKEQFWNGDVDAAFRAQLAESGISLERLRADSAAQQIPLTTAHLKYRVRDRQGNARGFLTPSRKVEFWSETFADHGYSALPDVLGPFLGAASSVKPADRFPLVLTCAKPSLFCQSQHRALPSLRKRSPYPEVELHPATAAARDIQEGNWVEVQTSSGAMRAKARFNETLDHRVVVGQHGWWQGCDEVGMTCSDPADPNGTNFNLTVDAAVRDPISGTPSHRSNMCEIRPLRSAHE
jgi:anaerobic selenocysteine-containing dehydrogenase